MKIGELATQSGVNAKLIRHYESIQLISSASRTEAGYRVYSGEDVRQLRFIKRARRLGFSIKDIKVLSALWQNKTRASRDVKHVAMTHIQDLEKKRDEIHEMIQALRPLVEDCHGNDDSECAILKGLDIK